MPTLFDSYSLKDVRLRNRIVVSPMCQYMSNEGVANDWHRVHYTSLARGGAGLVILEATAVSPEGRITWADAGLWNDTQAEALRPIIEALSSGGRSPEFSWLMRDGRHRPIDRGKGTITFPMGCRTLGKPSRLLQFRSARISPRFLAP